MMKAQGSSNVKPTNGVYLVKSPEWATKIRRGNMLLTFMKLIHYVFLAYTNR